MKQRPPTNLVWLLVGALGPTGCAVYQPMQSAAPAVRDRGQVEVSGGLSTPQIRLSAGVDYSPVRHLLVRVAVDGIGDKNDSTYRRNRQYEVAVGTYWPLGRHMLLGALGGVGQARSQVRYRVNYILSSGSLLREYDARYNKFFGEAYGLVQVMSGLEVGVAYRLTQVQFASLTDQGQPLDLHGMLRSEPTVFLRGTYGKGPQGDKLFYSQVGFAYSALLNAHPAQSGFGPAGNLLESNSYFTASLGFFPSALFRRP